MKLTKLPNDLSFAEVDFMVLFLSFVSKNEQIVLNIDSLEKRIFYYIEKGNLNTELPLTIYEDKKRVDLQKSISFLATVGIVSCHTGGDNSRKCTILLEEGEADDYIDTYSIISDEKVNEIRNMANYIYPYTKKVTKIKSKQNIIRIYSKKKN